jgi:cation channel sperm-associated protein subunit beta
MDEFLLGKAIDQDGTDLAETIPVNYRPPSTDGNGVIFAIPKSPNVYNVDPTKLKPREKLWKEPVLPVLHQCAGAKTPDCGCTKLDRFSNLISKSDCIAQVLRLFFSEVPYRPVFDVFQHGHDQLQSTYSIRLTELNGRDDWCYLDNAAADSPQWPDGSPDGSGTLNCDNRTAVSLFKLNSTDLNVGLIWHGPQLYHFRAELFGDTYCSLETQFKVWIYGEPVRPMVKYLTMTVTAVVIALVLLGIYVAQNGTAVKARDA